ncbi:tyrosine-protein phosphatase required for protection against superoxide stress (By similarity) [Saitoella coloradoensis]
MTSPTPFTRLIPPPVFAHVESNLYRSAQPSRINLPFLDTLPLHTIIWLAIEEPSHVTKTWAKERGVALVCLPVVGEGDSEEGWTGAESVKRVLELILETCAQNYGVLLMDQTGRHRIGTVIGCLRRLQRWNLASVSEEYCKFAGGKWRVVNELWIEGFDVGGVRVEGRGPGWL